MFYNANIRLNDLERTYGNNPLVQQNLSNMGYQGKTNTYAVIHGLQDAKTYPVIPNNTCILFDDEQSVFFKKTVDSMGVTELRQFEYTERPIETISPGIADKTDRSEIEELKNQINELKALFCTNLTENNNKNHKNMISNESAIKNTDVCKNEAEA